MNFAIDLDNPHQLLEVYDADPTQQGDGSWLCTYYGQVTVKDFGSPQFKRQTLCFPTDMRSTYRELAVAIDGKQCWFWRESFGSEALELAEAIATRDWLVINQTEERLRQRLPATKTFELVSEALNWLQAHNPAALEWLLFTEFGWKVQEHVEAILEAVRRQDPTRLQQAMFDKTGETLAQEQWGPRPGYADVGDRVFGKASEIAIDHLLRHNPQLLRWFVDHALNLPYEIQKQLLTEVRLIELLTSDKDEYGFIASSGAPKAKVRANYKKGAQERSLQGTKQQAIAIVKNGKVIDFQFDSTGDLELDEAIKKDLERVKDRVKLPANTKDGKVRVNITFKEKDSQQGAKPC